MPADLTSANLVTRTALVLDDQALAILENTGTASRVYRIPYSRVEHLLVSQNFPWVSFTVITLFMFLPGVLLFFVQEPVTNVIAAAILALALILIAYYTVCLRTTLTFAYGDRTRTFKFTSRPAKLARFLTRFDAAVLAAQKYEREQLELTPAPSPAPATSDGDLAATAAAPPTAAPPAPAPPPAAPPPPPPPA